MLSPIGSNITQNINLYPTFTGFQNLKYFGKVLYDGQERTTKTYMMPLKSGKRLFLDYKNGLLRRAGLSANGKSWIKKYFYTADEKLIKVEKDGEEIYTKNCGYVDSNTLSYYESINNGAIELGYDTGGRKVSTVIKPKLLRSLYTYIGNTITEMRYKITNVEVLDGNEWRIYKGKSGNYDIEARFQKRIDRNIENGHIITTTYDGINITSRVEKDKAGNIISKIQTGFTKGEKPSWVKETDGKGNLKFKKDTIYNDNGEKINDVIYNKAEGEFIKDITYDKNGNIVLTKISDKKGHVYSTIKNEYNDNGDIIHTQNINKTGEITEEENFIYDKNYKLTESHYKGSGTEDDDILEGDYYYKNGKISREIERFNSGIEESLYNKSGNLEKYTIKDTNGNVQKIYKHNYKAGKIKTTIKTDANDNILYTVKHSYKYNDLGEAHTKIFQKPNGEFILREVIITTENGEKRIYLDKEGKIINPAQYIKDLYG